MRGKSDTKVHSRPDVDQKGNKTPPTETTVADCGRPVWTSMAMPRRMVKDWIENGMSVETLCSRCLAANGLQEEVEKTVASVA